MKARSLCLLTVASRSCRGGLCGQLEVVATTVCCAQAGDDVIGDDGADGGVATFGGVTLKM